MSVLLPVLYVDALNRIHAERRDEQCCITKHFYS